MFCPLKGATRNPSSRNSLQRPVTSRLFPALDPVPWIIRVRAPGPPGRGKDEESAAPSEYGARMLLPTAMPTLSLEECLACRIGQVSWLPVQTPCRFLPGFNGQWISCTGLTGYRDGIAPDLHRLPFYACMAPLPTTIYESAP